jgi:hypothetical protein
MRAREARVGGLSRDTSFMTTTPVSDANETVRGPAITGSFYLHDFIEVHMGDVILTGYTEPFGMIGCQGVGPASIIRFIGETAEEVLVVEDQYIAIDSGENRLAFPIDGPSATGPESVRLFRPAQS